ncbi:hypothetical protein SO802_016131 [Lithocarpus litseifolius]|uniref:Uncharacterized protein n=1 Tax=Lithocarpus litseifolius TaxID=425828 RepID=A0AAW2CZU2_9ROSI
MAVAIGHQVITVHVSSLNGRTPTLVCVAQQQHQLFSKITAIGARGEVANEELKQARAMEESALGREQATKQRAERAKVARQISKEKAEKFKIVLVVSWVMFVVLLILYTRFGEVRRCLHNEMLTIYDMYDVVLRLYVERFDGNNVNGQVDGNCKFC